MIKQTRKKLCWLSVYKPMIDQLNIIEGHGIELYPEKHVGEDGILQTAKALDFAKNMFKHVDGFITEDKPVMALLAPHYPVYRLDELGRVYCISDTPKEKPLRAIEVDSLWARVSLNNENSGDYFFDDDVTAYNVYIRATRIIGDVAYTNLRCPLRNHVETHRGYTAKQLNRFFLDYNCKTSMLTKVQIVRINEGAKAYGNVCMFSSGIWFMIPELWPISPRELRVGVICRFRTPYGRLAFHIVQHLDITVQHPTKQEEAYLRLHSQGRDVSVYE